MVKDKTNSILTLVGITEELYRTNMRLNQVLTNALKNNTNTKSIEVHTELINKAITDLSEKFEVDIKNKTFLLNRQEIGRLRETLDDTLATIQRSYELGLYL